MEKQEIETWNTGIVDPKYVKNFIHYFCGAVLHECRYDCNNDFNKAYTSVFNTLRRVSHNNSDMGVTPITYDNLLEYLFNQKNIIPGYVSFWLQYCYIDLLGKPHSYKNRHFDIYTALQRIYIEQHRRWKQDEKDDIKYFKKTRRQICKMFRSGDYIDIFKMCNTSFLDTVSEQEIDNIADLMVNLFPKELSNCPDDEHAAAIGYIIGKYGAAKLHI